MFVSVSIFDPLEQFGVINYCSNSSNVSTFGLAVLSIFFFLYCIMRYFLTLYVVYITIGKKKQVSYFFLRKKKFYY
jgi:hypothetical protein